MSGAMSKEPIASEPLEELNRRRAGARLQEIACS